MASIRRWGLPGLASIVGVLLLVCGIAVLLVDAQLRSDAATAAATLTSEQRQQLEDAGLDPASVEANGRDFRRTLIQQNLSSGGTMPEQALLIEEMDDGNVYLSWGYSDGFIGNPWGGLAWQLKPLGILSFAGLALIIGAVFAAGARWESRHPLG